MLTPQTKNVYGSETIDGGTDMSVMMKSEPGVPQSDTASSAYSGWAEIVAAYRTGLGVEVIARRVRLPVRQIYWVLGRENVPIRSSPARRGTRQSTFELLRRIRAMRAAGSSYKQIARVC